MAAPVDSQPPREPLPPAGGGGDDRAGLPTARRLHGELASAAFDSAMADSPIPRPGATADERLEEALRRIGQTLPPSDQVRTPGLGQPGALQDPSHGASSMQFSPPPFPSSSSTTHDDAAGRKPRPDGDDFAGRKPRSVSHPRSRRPSEIPLSSGSLGPTAFARQQVSNWESRRSEGTRNPDRFKVLTLTIAKSRSPSVRSYRGAAKRSVSSRPPQQSIHDMAELREFIDTFTTHQVSSVAADMAKLRSELEHVISEITGKISEIR